MTSPQVMAPAGGLTPACLRGSCTCDRGTCRSLVRLLEGLAPYPAWMTHARCAGRNPGLWFPAPGDSRGHAQAAKRICRVCPVRAACLAWALQRRELHGIWGGLAPRERRALLRSGRAAV